VNDELAAALRQAAGRLTALAEADRLERTARLVAATEVADAVVRALCAEAGRLRSGTSGPRPGTSGPGPGAGPHRTAPVRACPP
jgi:hypothetical protein